MKKRMFFVVVLIFAVFASLLSSCASEKNEAAFVTESYGKAVSESIAKSGLSEAFAGNTFVRLEDGYAAAEADGIYAGKAIEAGLASYWYPQFAETVVIAADRDRTDAKISGWSDLFSGSGFSVALADEPGDTQKIMCAVSRGLDGESFSMKNACAAMKEKYGRGELITESRDADADVFICFDFQAAQMIKNGRNIEIIVPEEGTLSFSKGLLSKRELIISENAGTELVNAGFRLEDGTCDGSIYPAEGEYSDAKEAVDSGDYYAAYINSMKLLRREVMGSHIFSTANGREHIFAILMFIIVTIIWSGSVYRRSSMKSIKRASAISGGLLTLWAVIRAIKWLWIGYGVIVRYLWYGYYIPILLLPLVFLWMADAVDRESDDGRPPSWWWPLLAAAAVLLAAVFTNDLHFTVFRFDPNGEFWSSEYSYGPVYYAVLAMSMLPAFTGIAILLIKDMRNKRRKSFLFPMVIIAALIVYILLYIAGSDFARESDMTVVIGVFTLLFYEAGLRMGLIPINTKYRGLFENSPLRMRIIDTEGKTVMRAKGADPLPDGVRKMIVSGCRGPISQDENVLVYSGEITGGKVVWQEDISVINTLRAEISESVRMLSKTNNMLASEEKIRSKLEAAKARTEILGELENEISNQTEKMSRLVRDIGENTADREKLSKLAMMACYIKRRCNLFFWEQEQPRIAADELAAYLDELSEMAAYRGVKAAEYCSAGREMPVRTATLFYDFFYAILDRAADEGCKVILGNVVEEEGKVIMKLLPSGHAEKLNISQDLLKAICAAGGELTRKDLDEAVGIWLSFPEGGRRS